MLLDIFIVEKILSNLDDVDLKECLLVNVAFKSVCDGVYIKKIKSLCDFPMPKDQSPRTFWKALTEYGVDKDFSPDNFINVALTAGVKGDLSMFKWFHDTIPDIYLERLVTTNLISINEFSTNILLWLYEIYPDTLPAEVGSVQMEKIFSTKKGQDLYLQIKEEYWDKPSLLKYDITKYDRHFMCTALKTNNIEALKKMEYYCKYVDSEIIQDTIKDISPSTLRFLKEKITMVEFVNYLSDNPHIENIVDDLTWWSNLSSKNVINQTLLGSYIYMRNNSGKPLDIAVLDWFKDKNKRFKPGITQANKAVKYRDYDAINWMASQGVFPNASGSTNALKNLDTRVVAWLASPPHNVYPSNAGLDDTIRANVKSEGETLTNLLELADWCWTQVLKEQGKFKQATINAALFEPNYRILEWFIKIGKPPIELTILESLNRFCRTGQNYQEHIEQLVKFGYKDLIITEKSLIKIVKEGIYSPIDLDAVKTLKALGAGLTPKLRKVASQEVINIFLQ